MHRCFFFLTSYVLEKKFKFATLVLFDTRNEKFKFLEILFFSRLFNKNSTVKDSCEN